MEDLKEYFSKLFTGISLVAVLAAFVAYIVNDEDWLVTKYALLIDWYQIALCAALFILLPLSAIRPIQILLFPGFASARVILFFCSTCIDTLTLYALWGNTGVTIGLLMGGVGIFPLSVIACVINGKWVMLAHILISTAAFVGCFIAEIMVGSVVPGQEDRPTGAPGNVKQASNATWMSLFLALPFLYGFAIKDNEGIVMAAFSSLTLVGMAVGIRRGYKIALVVGLLTIAYGAPSQMHWFSDFDLNGILNQDGKAYISLLGVIQNILAAYTFIMLLTPTSLRWFWKSRLTKAITPSA